MDPRRIQVKDLDSAQDDLGQQRRPIGSKEPVQRSAHSIVVEVLS